MAWLTSERVGLSHCCGLSAAPEQEAQLEKLVEVRARAQLRVGEHLTEVLVKLLTPPRGEGLVLGGVGALGRESRHTRSGDAEGREAGVELSEGRVAARHLVRVRVRVGVRVGVRVRVRVRVRVSAAPSSVRHRCRRRWRCHSSIAHLVKGRGRARARARARIGVRSIAHLA